MHPQCMQAGHFNGTYEFFDRETSIRSLEGEEMLPPGTPYNYEILSVDVTGDVALVKVVDGCFGTTFTDCLTLIKNEIRWQIVMKAFFDRANAWSSSGRQGLCQRLDEFRRSTITSPKRLCCLVWGGRYDT